MLMALDTGTVSESNHHTWDKKLQVGVDLKAQVVTLTELKKTLKQWWTGKRMPLYSYCCSDLQKLYRS